MPSDPDQVIGSCPDKTLFYQPIKQSLLHCLTFWFNILFFLEPLICCTKHGCRNFFRHLLSKTNDIFPNFCLLIRQVLTNYRTPKLACENALLCNKSIVRVCVATLAIVIEGSKIAIKIHENFLCCLSPVLFYLWWPVSILGLTETRKNLAETAKINCRNNRGSKVRSSTHKYTH